MPWTTRLMGWLTFWKTNDLISSYIKYASIIVIRIGLSSKHQQRGSEAIVDIRF